MAGAWQGKCESDTAQQLRSVSVLEFFLISNFRLVVNVVLFLSGYSQASESYVPTIRNTLFYLHR
jgi:hypothetical protein